MKSIKKDELVELDIFYSNDEKRYIVLFNYTESVDSITFDNRFFAWICFKRMSRKFGLIIIPEVNGWNLNLWEGFLYRINLLGLNEW